MNCDNCKRELNGTLHTKDSYKVDHYKLWTGKTIPVVFQEDGDEERKFSKIEESALVVVCVKCYAEPFIGQAFQAFESPFKPK